jgi:hypothetical protein
MTIVERGLELVADGSRIGLGTGLFLDMADTVLVGDKADFRTIEERRRTQAPGIRK